jgi:hypothetical protein
MKVFTVEKSGKLSQLASMDNLQGKKGGVFEVEWTVCYKINEDGTDVIATVATVGEKHRGAGEHVIISDYMSVTDFDPRKSRAVQSEILASEEDKSRGLGQDPPSAEGVLSEAENERQRQMNAPRIDTEDAPRETQTF